MIARCRLISLPVLVLIGLTTASAQDKPQPLEQAAKAFVELLDKGEFAKATRDFDATMQKVMPPDDLKKTWEKVLGDAGAFKKQLATRIETKDKYQIVFVTCEFAKAK